MIPIPNHRPYFFQHQNKDGYIVAIQKGVDVYYVVIMDDEKELLSVTTYTQKNVQLLYETFYRWLAYCPGDIPRKCLILRSIEDLSIALQRLPLAEVSITIPDLKQLEFEEFKKTVKK